LAVSGPSCRHLPAQRVQKSDDGRRPGDIDQERRVASVGGARSDVCRLRRRSLGDKLCVRLRHTHGRSVRHGRGVQRRPDDGRGHRLAGFAGSAAAVGRTTGRPVQRRSHRQRLQTSRQHGLPVGPNRLRDVNLRVKYCLIVATDVYTFTLVHVRVSRYRYRHSPSSIFFLHLFIFSSLGHHPSSNANK